ncbi:UNKNOWN [Stylonychia lemnae]|uniref:Uncharacterized protein n=1 Tax=Stylonychia lemnae TaxID=5949 RepID=A0A078AG80_STYLE|nr:UNKNOWN [Stylonychia lemnae]|eukprot:CDW81310.1 UNKNOWN [Stylonychia lemnae]
MIQQRCYSRYHETSNSLSSPNHYESILSQTDEIDSFLASQVQISQEIYPPISNFDEVYIESDFRFQTSLDDQVIRNIENQRDALFDDLLRGVYQQNNGYTQWVEAVNRMREELQSEIRIQESQFQNQLIPFLKNRVAPIFQSNLQVACNQMQNIIQSQVTDILPFLQSKKITFLNPKRNILTFQYLVGLRQVALSLSKTNIKIIGEDFNIVGNNTRTYITQIVCYQIFEIKGQIILCLFKSGIRQKYSIQLRNSVDFSIIGSVEVQRKVFAISRTNKEEVFIVGFEKGLVQIVDLYQQVIRQEYLFTQNTIITSIYPGLQLGEYQGFIIGTSKGLIYMSLSSRQDQFRTSIIHVQGRDSASYISCQDDLDQELLLHTAIKDNQSNVYSIQKQDLFSQDRNRGHHFIVLQSSQVPLLITIDELILQMKKVSQNEGRPYYIFQTEEGIYISNIFSNHPRIVKMFKITSMILKQSVFQYSSQINTLAIDRGDSQDNYILIALVGSLEKPSLVKFNFSRDFVRFKLQQEQDSQLLLQQLQIY